INQPCLGKLKLGVPYRDLFPGAVESNGFTVVPSNLGHYEGLLTLPKHHGDPFDRLLILQARLEGFALVSCDPRFKPFGVSVLW
ncbi:MAG TPA: type II toxin-antitoxin system VapC family toxin, partial [Verrucomicrobiae bacterium]|nr:type II toxin-antitoxin system VapC family toxin [Verrucomicrobiae bacterium]